MRVRLLIVEDDPIVQELIKTYAESLDFDGEICGSGEEALIAAAGRAYDVILMDQQMPGMNGLEAAQKIRDSGNMNSKTPIIAVSGYERDAHREAALGMGVNDFLSKPFDVEQLRIIVEKWTGHPGAYSSAGADISEKKMRPGDHLPLDLERLRKLSGGSAETGAQFFEEIFELLAGLRKAASDRDKERISRLAHRCAGLAAFAGMPELSRSLFLLESMGEENDLSSAGALVERSFDLANRAKVFLEESVKGGTFDAANSDR
jgi:CheY-like chemotaxis protein